MHDFPQGWNIRAGSGFRAQTGSPSRGFNCVDDPGESGESLEQHSFATDTGR